MRTKFLMTKTNGFTLIELMVTVAIIAILSTIAYGTYTSSVLRSHRTDAKSALLDIAGREERLYSTTNTYSAVPTDVGYPGTTANQSFTVGSGYYQVSISATGTTFTITATAVGSQANDTSCKTLSVDQLGSQTSKDNGGNDSTATCWK